MCEFRLEIVGYTHEPFVEAAEPQHYIATYRKISAHELLDPCGPNCGEMEAIVIRKILAHLPRLNDAAGYKRSASFLQRTHMRLNKSGMRDDVVIKK
jgi:hypothetical protein